MSKTKFLIAATMLLSVAACTPGTNTSLYSIHQPVVDRTNYSVDLDTSSGELSAFEERRLGEWFDALELRYGDRVAVDFGDGVKNVVVNQKVANLAAERGIILSGLAPVTQGIVVPGTARVVVTRSSASVPTCPDWSTDSELNDNASNHSNYGCATNSNLAAMIADPEDLVRGRSAAPLDRNEGTAIINTQRAKRNGGN